MQFAQSLVETGYTLLAIVVPLIWIILIFLCRRNIRKSAKETERAARNSTTDSGAVIAYAVGGVGSIFLALTQVILFLLLIINVLIVTIPYGNTHGLW